MKKKTLSVLRNAGGFIACMIGPGFATGQEILQFFAGFGYFSFGALTVNLLVSVGLTCVLMEKGRQHRHLEKWDHYTYYCGRVMGRFFRMVIPVTLVMIIAVLLSAAGATMYQYMGVSRAVGCVAMAALLLTSYFIGFERMVRVISAFSPLVILFSIFVGIYAAVRDIRLFGTVADASARLAAHRSSPNWILSAFLYCSLNFLSGSPYCTELGRTSPDRRSTLLGAVIGSLAISVALCAMNTAILLGGEAVSEAPVPALAIAQTISPVFGAVFSIVLVLGMFACCASVFWSFCSGFFRNDIKKNRLFAAFTICACLALGLFPFEKLQAVLYPIIGYAGLFFVPAVLIRPLRRDPD